MLLTDDFIGLIRYRIELSGDLSGSTSIHARQPQKATKSLKATQIDHNAGEDICIISINSEKASSERLTNEFLCGLS